MLHKLGRERQRNAWLLVALLCAGITIFALASGQDRTIARAAFAAFGGYVALLWGAVLYHTLAPRRPSCWHAAMAGIFTATVGVAVLLVLEGLPPFRALFSATDSGRQVPRLIAFVFGVGLFEEAVKLAPVLWLLHKSRLIAAPRDGAFYGAVSGLGFAVAETLARVFSFGPAGLNLDTPVTQNMLRLTTLAFNQGIWAALAGYYAGLAVIRPRHAWLLSLAGLALATLLHGLYDFFASIGDWLNLVVVAVSIVLFVNLATAHGAETE